MSIFGFGKKKEEQKQSCCCGGNCTPETMQVAEAEKKESGIKILGGGCAKCNALEAATEEALRELGMDATIDHIPEPDIAISMGCNVGCPFIGRPFDDNWELEDPTGKSDEEFKKVIDEIRVRIMELKQRLGKNIEA